MQRYTVLASAALLVPLILGAVAYLVPPLAATSSVSLSGEIGTAATEGADISQLLLACQAYLIINAALSSLLLALSESDVKKAALYFAFCAPCAIAAFAMASGGAILPSL
jgi:hypothetical protein